MEGEGTRGSETCWPTLDNRELLVASTWLSRPYKSPGDRHAAKDSKSKSIGTANTSYNALLLHVFLKSSLPPFFFLPL